MNVYISIKNQLIKLLKEAYPDFDIFAEEINKTSENPNYFFIEVMPMSNELINKYHIQRSIFISIEGHLESELNVDYLNMMAKLESKIKNVFRFNDRAITIRRANSKIVNRALLYTFDIIFIDSIDNDDDKNNNNELDLMQEVSIKKESD
ncbi:MAG: hypothetical protein R3Y29_06580 [bacterium]